MCLFAHLNWGCKSRGAADTADRPHADQCECLPPAPGRAKENSTGGCGKGAAGHTPFDHPITRAVPWTPRRRAKLVVPILRDERLKLMENSFSATSYKCSHPFSCKIEFNVLSVKILSLKSGLLSSTMLPTEQH